MEEINSREDEAIITFNSGQAKVALKGHNSFFNIRWYCDDEYVGEYELKSGMWASFPLRLGNWRIEFWEHGEKVSEFFNNLENSPILIITELNPTISPGKLPSVSKLLDRANEIKAKYNCEVVFYFKGSEKFDISPLKTLKLNDEYDFSMILEENYG